MIRIFRQVGDVDGLGVGFKTEKVTFGFIQAVGGFCGETVDGALPPHFVQFTLGAPSVIYRITLLFVSPDSNTEDDAACYQQADAYLECVYVSIQRGS